jgi:hypothetical protein
MEGKRILVSIAHDLNRSNVEVVGEFGRVGIPGVIVARVGFDYAENHDKPPRLYLEIDATCVDVVGIEHPVVVRSSDYAARLRATADALEAQSKPSG